MSKLGKLVSKGIELPHGLVNLVLKLEIKDAIDGDQPQPVDHIITMLLPYTTGFGGDESFDPNCPLLAHVSPDVNLRESMCLDLMAIEVLMRKVVAGESQKKWVLELCKGFVKAVEDNTKDSCKAGECVAQLVVACKAMMAIMCTDPNEKIEDESDLQDIRDMLSYNGSRESLKCLINSLDTEQQWKEHKNHYKQVCVAETTIIPAIKKVIDTIVADPECEGEGTNIQFFEAAKHLKHWRENTSTGVMDKMLQTLLDFLAKMAHYYKQSSSTTVDLETQLDGIANLVAATESIVFTLIGDKYCDRFKLCKASLEPEMDRIRNEMLESELLAAMKGCGVQNITGGGLGGSWL